MERHGALSPGPGGASKDGLGGLQLVEGVEPPRRAHLVSKDLADDGHLGPGLESASPVASED